MHAKCDFIFVYVMLPLKFENKTMAPEAFICELLQIGYLCKVKISRQ